MFLNDLTQTCLHTIRATTDIDPNSGALHTTVSVRRKSPDHHGIYVAHPISGIRVGRIHDMQRRVVESFGKANAGTGRVIAPFFPMRTTHLAADEIGANEYGDSKALFGATRAFTLQNRMDAILNSDAVLINFELKDDDGNYRLSKGIPFDYGWAAACGKPIVAVIPKDNPNWCPMLSACCTIADELDEGIASLSGMLAPASQDSVTWKVVAEVFEFGADASLDYIARLAMADARKHLEGERAIISIIPDGAGNPNWHGQVAQVSDWVLSDPGEAEYVVRRLIAA